MKYRGERETVQNSRCGLFSFVLFLLVLPLAKQFHSLKATGFQISNNLKKKVYMLKIQKSVLCITEDFKYYKFIFLSYLGNISPRAIVHIAFSIVQSDKYRDCTSVRYHFDIKG